MKVYSKTYRRYKDHKASDCGLCAERVVRNSNGAIRQKAKISIKRDIENEGTGE